MADQAQHSPGPWAIRTQPVEGTRVEVTDAEGHWVADARAWNGRGPKIATQEANAHLIAAAPELLEALREIDRLASKVGRDAITKLARAAIAKTQGATHG
jgi:hypothetical protein